eukprot:scaffold237170_cov18-Tisochrysis_lutea.AAC.2
MVTQVKASVAWGRVLKVYELQGPLQVDLRGVMDVNMGLLQGEGLEQADLRGIIDVYMGLMQGEGSEPYHHIKRSHGHLHWAPARGKSRIKWQDTFS